MTLGETVALAIRKLSGATSEIDKIDEWHKLNVAAMNRYIGNTENYILAMEALLPVEVVLALRVEHQRSDTRAMRDAGAWEER